MQSVVSRNFSLWLPKEDVNKCCSDSEDETYRERFDIETRRVSIVITFRDHHLRDDITEHHSTEYQKEREEEFLIEYKGLIWEDVVPSEEEHGNQYRQDEEDNFHNLIQNYHEKISKKGDKMSTI